VQECRREWAQAGKELSWDDLTRLAAEAEPLCSLVNPSDRRFLPPGDMAQKIQRFCAETAQPVPTSKGAIVRCVLESLALTYRRVMEQLETVLGREHSSIHIIGGGSRNSLLNQFTADAIGRPVVAGPAEAASIGNILMQALAVGHIGSLEEGRDLVRRSFDVTTFEPGEKAAWDDAYGRYLGLIETSDTGP